MTCCYINLEIVFRTGICISNKYILLFHSKNRNETVGGTKTFTDLNVKDLFFSSINDITSENILYHDSESLVINGNLIFEKPVAIMKNIKTKLINGMPRSSIPNLKKHIFGNIFALYKSVLPKQNSKPITLMKKL